MTWRRKKNLLL